jgi:hypothetical protein
VKAAWRHGYRGLACIIATAWDTQFSPVDVRTLQERHRAYVDGRIVMRANQESGVTDYLALLELARRASTEELAHCVERGRKGVERNRAVLQAIERLATEGSEVSADNNQGSIGGRAAMQRKARRELKLYEDILSIAATVLGERRQ